MKTEKLNTLLRDVSNVRDPVKQVNWKSKNHPNDYEDTEAVVRRCSVRKVSLEISQNSQESTWVRNSFLIKLQDLKKSLWHRCFHVNVAKFLRTPFLTEHLRWLLPCLVLETARSDCSNKNLQAYLNHLKIEPIFSKFSHSLLQMSSVLGPFLGKF